MTIEIYPVKIEAIDDVNDPVFRIEALDEAAATLHIDTCISINSWPEISEAIMASLKMMRLHSCRAHGETQA